VQQILFSPSRLGMSLSINGWSLWKSEHTLASKCSRISWSKGSNFTPAGSLGKSRILVETLGHLYLFLK